MDLLDVVDMPDLQSIDLDQALVANNSACLFTLSRVFDALSQEAKEDNEIRSVSYKFLSCLCSIHLRADNIAQPFSPMFCGPNGRISEQSPILTRHHYACGYNLRLISEFE
jgi:hypothetical protein